MNYANMIEEKNLKKTFIIATLVSTLIGTFASSHNLYERLREKHQQEKRDEGQNQEIKKLKDEIDQMKKGKKGKDDDSSGSSSEDDRPRRRRSKSRRRSRDNLLEYLDRSPALIRREYDQGYDRWGQRFASGDVVTENQLQAQIISLQQTVIQVLQDALENGRRLRRTDIDRLVQASQSAQHNSVDALRSQYHRYQHSGGGLRLENGGSSSSSQHHRRQRSLPPPKLRQITDTATRGGTVATAVASRALTASHPAASPAAAVHDVSIFCPYSLDLQQQPRKNLNIAFAPGGGSRCPVCEVRIPVDGEEEWTIGKRKRSLVAAGAGADGRGGREGEVVVEHCEFHVTARFVVKCHTESGEYACVLCSENRGVDLLCADPEALVAHVGRKHKIGEYEREIDLEQD
ncbi:hypothetical protein EV356DRAFT_523238 [Viridothelium virens]|uniref:Uncharacterized protein n=1 Tax=Viridothelium virens TaxID=1048519 RepID=A0A6A6HBM9_VIRVR|nr:hypothetical protein EV356DRAFT_523238 [Viridothelium virens]